MSGTVCNSRQSDEVSSQRFMKRFIIGFSIVEAVLFGWVILQKYIERGL